MLLGFSVAVLVLDAGGVLSLGWGSSGAGAEDDVVAVETVLPAEGVDLAITWGDLGRQLLEAGVIDGEAFEALYAERGGLTPEQRAFLYEADNDSIRVNAGNANFILNLFWALGLANQNVILTDGPMQAYGDDPGQFASTGGWSLAKGSAMDHYSRHAFIALTPEQQTLVEDVSKGIFRPCCGNSTYFPDCNHGMAMLGFLQLLASQGASEKVMYEQALVLNSFWFPDTYLTLAQYFQNEGTPWRKVDPKVVLGVDYSSGSGYRNVLTAVEPRSASGGGGCGV